MPDPISSSNTRVPCNLGSDPSLDDAGAICRAEATAGAPPAPIRSEPPAPPPAVSKLISAVSTPVRLPTGETNAERTTERTGGGRYADAGITRYGDAIFAGAAMVKERDPKTGIEVEAATASIQVGLESEVQAGMARLGVSGKHGSAVADVFTVRANEGIHNDDGSIGFNAGAVANIVAAEGTLSHGGDSVTLGLAGGIGAAFSGGFRDVDHDGVSEICLKSTIGPVTLGICVEAVP